MLGFIGAWFTEIKNFVVYNPLLRSWIQILNIVMWNEHEKVWDWSVILIQIKSEIW